MLNKDIDLEGLELPAPTMTPEERFEELASILARGCRRAVRDAPPTPKRNMDSPAQGDVRLSDLSAPFAHE